MEVVIATEEHLKYAETIAKMMESAAKERGTGIAKRSVDYLQKKISEGKAVICVDGENVAGFCYVESWGHDKFVANSGLIVNSNYRKMGLAKKIKSKIFQLSRKKFPNAKIFGITTSLPVMKINAELGYQPVTFSELTDDEQFWKGCQTCKNFDILTRTNRSHCLCTGMLFDPAKVKEEKKETSTDRWDKFKRFVKLKSLKAKRKLVKK
ncbi:MAG: GNAT family N-acetyltransferase [Cyclobacteriaceae bacterium]